MKKRRSHTALEPRPWSAAALALGLIAVLAFLGSPFARHVHQPTPTPIVDGEHSSVVHLDPSAQNLEGACVGCLLRVKTFGDRQPPPRTALRPIVDAVATIFERTAPDSSPLALYDVRGPPLL